MLLSGFLEFFLGNTFPFTVFSLYGMQEAWFHCHKNVALTSRNRWRLPRPGSNTAALLQLSWSLLDYRKLY